MNFAYALNIPASGNDPSDDQPLMQQNTNSINGIIGIDHITFGAPLGGYHQQATLLNLLAIPTTTGTNRGVVYTKKTTNSAAGTESSLFFTPDATGKEYQLTRTINGQFALFAANTLNYAAPTATLNFQGGWTFLPGGMLFQYGTASLITPTSSFGPANVPFPINFTNPAYSVTMSGRNGTGAVTNLYSVTAITNSKFSITSSGSAIVSAISWMAIGV